MESDRPLARAQSFPKDIPRSSFHRPAPEAPRSARPANVVVVIEIPWIPELPGWEDVARLPATEPPAGAWAVRDDLEVFLSSSAKGHWIRRDDAKLEVLRLVKRSALFRNATISMWAGSTSEEWDLIALNLALRAPRFTPKFMCAAPRVKLEDCGGVSIIQTPKHGMPIPSLAHRHHDVSGDMKAVADVIQASVDEGLWRNYARRDLWRSFSVAREAGLIDNSAVNAENILDSLNGSTR